MFTQQFSVPGNPRGKARPRFYSGHAVTPPETRAYEELIAWSAKQRWVSPLAGPVEFEVDAYFPIPQSWSKQKQEDARSGKLKHTSKPDGSNVLKVAEDALNGVAYLDDAQICWARVQKFYSDEPRLDIRIRYHLDP